VPAPRPQRRIGRDTDAFDRAVDTLISPRGHASESRLDAACARLRRASPVHWVDSPGIRPFWAVMRHADIVSVELRSEQFAAAPRTYLASELAERILRQVTGKPQVVRGLTEMDEPDHDAYRAILQASFAPAALRTLQVWLGMWATQTVDRIDERGGVCDFAGEVAAPFSFRVIARLLGTPEADDAALMRLTQGFVGAEDPHRQLDETLTEAIRLAMVGLRDYFEPLAADRRAHPRDDLASLIANAKVDGARIPHYEMISYFILMVTAGHDTTALALAGGLRALLAHPDQLERLRREPALLESAIEEILRWTSPVRHFMRTAKQDALIGQQPVRAGQSLALFFNSGNRDETVFVDAGAFRIDRSPNPHIAFGRGPHFCMGHQLARMEIGALFSELLRRTKRIEPAGRPRRAQSTFISGVSALPIRCTFG
jgi:cytochrome P450